MLSPLFVGLIVNKCGAGKGTVGPFLRYVLLYCCCTLDFRPMIAVFNAPYCRGNNIQRIQ